jgi:hypothetical protein
MAILAHREFTLDACKGQRNLLRTETECINRDTFVLVEPEVRIRE